MNGQDKILGGLNSEQLKAVTHVDGPLLVLAGAGSGKTKVLTSRVAHLVAQGHAAPEQILAVTFTNKAAGEMKARIERLTEIDQRRMQVSTFHSFSSLMLRFYGDRIGVPQNYTIYDEDDAMSLVKTSIAELGLDIKTTAPQMVRSKISDAKSQLVDSAKYLTMAGNFITERVARVYELYQKKLFAARAVDFDDLLFYAVKILRDNEETRMRLQSKYHYVMIDEYQDTNHAQYMLAKLLTAGHKNLFAVGDEDQSIYGWRGATIDNILNFEKDYPNCRIIRLEQNYRSTQTILKAASEVVAYNQMRKGKTLYSVGDKGDPVTLLIVETDRDEAEKICENIETLVAQGVIRREIAILYRTNAQSRAIEESLKRRFIPYRIVGGLRFYQRKEIKDMMAYLRLIENPKDDVSFKRVVNYPKRGIGDTTVAAMSELARSKNLSLFELAIDKGANAELGRTVVVKLAKFVEIINYFKEMSRSLPLEPLLTLVAEQSGINKDLKENDPSGTEGRLDNVAELASSAGDFGVERPEATLADFLQEISLYTDLDNWDRESDTVTLMTIHAAKGLEFEAVFVAGLEEGLFPLGRSLENPADLEEERRLFYVAMTRAKKRLFISYANTRARLGGRQSIRSRFVDELPDEVVVAERHTMVNAYGAVNSDYEHAMTMQNDQFAAIRVGSSVAHARWGEGTVLKRSGSGDSTEVEVRFHFAGTKKLLAKYAKLRVLA
ncbi:MAG: UvrD-helicase domain-containing protein [bacterium]|nr:UvrD-helicase domain-containing protein [bacterium]